MYTPTVAYLRGENVKLEKTSSYYTIWLRPDAEQELDLIRDTQLSFFQLNQTSLQYPTPICQPVGMCTKDPQINMFLKEMQNNPREAQKQMMSDRLQLMGHESGARLVHDHSICLK